MAVSNVVTLSELLAKHWLEAFRRSPKWTTFLSLIAVCIGAVTFYFASAKEAELRDRARRENASYAVQLAQLSNTEASLKSLIEFVGSEKAKLRETEDLLVQLQAERDRLKPAVETDRRTVDAILSLQEGRFESSKWRERWIGFGFGVLASLIASFLFVLLKSLYDRLRAKRPNPAMQPTAGNPG